MLAVPSHLAPMQMLLLITFHSQLNLFLRGGGAVGGHKLPIVLFPSYKNSLIKN